MTKPVSTKHVATKDYTCGWCEHKISEGTQYVRRPENAGTRYKTGRYHLECADALVSEIVKGKK